MVDTFLSFPFLSLLLGINWRLRIDNNIAVSKEEREEKGGVLPATDDKREIDEGFVMAQNVSKSAVAQPLSHAPAHNYSHLACSRRTTSRSCISTSEVRAPKQSYDSSPIPECAHRCVLGMHVWIGSNVEPFPSDR